jgi:hypothetical protein
MVKIGLYRGEYIGYTSDIIRMALFLKILEFYKCFKFTSQL